MLDEKANIGLDDEIGATILARYEERTLLAGTAELIEEYRIEARLLARHLKHIVPNGIGRRRMTTLTEMKAVLGEETRVRLPGACARKVLELTKGLHVYGESLRRESERDERDEQQRLTILKTDHSPPY